jgi:hypothetical protein
VFEVAGCERQQAGVVRHQVPVADVDAGRADAHEHVVALDLLLQLAGPPSAIDDTGDTRAELLAAVTDAMRAVTATPFGPVIRGLLSQIALTPELGDPFRAGVVQGRRDQVRGVIARGVARGDLRPDADADLATELLVGPVYFRLMFGGDLTRDFAERLVDSVLDGFRRRDPAQRAAAAPAALRSPPPARPRSPSERSRSSRAGRRAGTPTRASCWRSCRPGP